MNYMATTIQTSSGKLYNLSQAERDWVAGFGERSSEALICIHHALVYSRLDAEWLTDVITENAYNMTQNDNLQAVRKLTIPEYCKQEINRCRTEDPNFSVIIELAHMPDGTPCCLAVWRDAHSDYGLGRPYFWITFSCNADGMLTAMTSGFYPSVHSVVRSGIYPGITIEKLKQLAEFRQEKLQREQQYFFMLVGFPFSKELDVAEKIVSDALSEFPGSTLSIFNQIDSDDPQIYGQFYRRGINSVPYLSIYLNDDQILRLDGPFDAETLSNELDVRFSSPAIVKQQFKPCDNCLKQYRSLKYYPESSYCLSILPELPTLVWNDEHPESGLSTVNHNHQCNDWFHCLFTARNYIWESGKISDEHKAFWNEARTLVPDWPGFQRLNLNDKQMESYRACSDEGLTIRDFVIRSGGEISYRCITPGFVKWMFVLHPPKVISTPT